MSLNNQLQKLKENWLIVAAFVILLLFMNVGSVADFGATNFMGKSMRGFDMAMAESAIAPPYIGSDFAPEVEERKITKSTSLSTQVDRGTFQNAQNRVKSIISSSDSILLSENVNKYGTKRNEYFHGNYQIKVDTLKYDALITQLKEIGEVQSFNENVQDVTGQYNNADINLETEVARLTRYQEMYAKATEVSDKINLNDRIFDQERRIKYLEDSLENLDNRIDYSTIYFSVSEKESDYAHIAFVKISELIGSFVDSLNSLISLIFLAIPWAIALALGVYVWKFLRRRYW